jgi:glycosyltransferase involved in cell wall biosynthesis
MIKNTNTETVKVSVVMSFYKEPLQWIEHAVQSILNQTFKDFEFIIICDDAENKAGIEYINEIGRRDSRVKLTVNPTNMGPTRCLNKAISLADGTYVARMDADDIAHPERFERQVSYLDEHPEAMVCSTDVHIVDESERILRRNRYKYKYNPTRLLLQNTISHPTVMFRSCLSEWRNPIYNEDYLYAQDYELWQYLYLKGIRPHTITEPLLLLRKSRAQISCARKQQQTEFFRSAHRKFITEYLFDKNIISRQEAGDLKKMLEKCSAAFKKAEGLEQEELTYIIYLIYFSLTASEWKYAFRYLTDSNMIIFRMRFIFTLRLFFSSKKRRYRNSLI